VTLAEQVILVSKIQSRRKMEKIKDSLNIEVEGLRTAQTKMVEEKEREGLELLENIKVVNSTCEPLVSI